MTELNGVLLLNYFLMDVKVGGAKWNKEVVKRLACK